MYFVIYQGNINKDPLDVGCEASSDYTWIVSFAERMENKGYSVSVYEGSPKDWQRNKPTIPSKPLPIRNM